MSAADQQIIICYNCDGTGNDATFSDHTCTICRGRKKILGSLQVCTKCGHLKSAHNGDYSFTGNNTECSEEISDDGTNCGCVPILNLEDGSQVPSFATAIQRLGEIQKLKRERREKLIKENKATPDL